MEEMHLNKITCDTITGAGFPAGLQITAPKADIIKNHINRSKQPAWEGGVPLPPESDPDTWRVSLPLSTKFYEEVSWTETFLEESKADDERNLSHQEKKWPNSTRYV